MSGLLTYPGNSVAIAHSGCARHLPLSRWLGLLLAVPNGIARNCGCTIHKAGAKEHIGVVEHALL
eukprot:5092609-Amphidinium_carterae.2